MRLSRLLPLVLCLTLSAGAGASPVSEHLDRAFTRFAELDQWSGAVLVADRTGVLLRAGYGSAHRELDVPMGPDHRFVIGSMSKAFTAAVLLELDRRGTLDLDAAVTSIWPGFEDPSGGTITVRHLLTHRSGLEHWGGINGFLLTEAFVAHDREVLVNRYAAVGLRFDPGTDEGYSSPGYMAAAIVSEHATGRPFAELRRELILDPLGMTSTVTTSDDLQPGRVADYRYDFVHARYVNAEYRHPSTLFATGDLLTTVDDLLRWSEAIRGQHPDVLAPEVLAVMLDPDAGARAYGWQKATFDESAPGQVVWHGGLVAGYRSQIVIDLHAGRTIVLLGNLRDIDSMRLVNATAELLDGTTTDPVRRTLMKEVLRLSAEDPSRVVARIEAILDGERDAYYDDPVSWLLAAVELRSDGVHGRALPIYELWIERNPDHGLVGAAMRHALDCAVVLGDRDRARSLLDRIRESSEDPDEIAALEERVGAMR